MKSITRGAVYLCSECDIANRVFDRELSYGNKISGHEAAQYGIIYNRPVVVLSTSNRFGGRITVVPLSSRTQDQSGTPSILITGNTTGRSNRLPGVPPNPRSNSDFIMNSSYVCLNWVKSVSQRDLFHLIGFIENEELDKIDAGVQFMMGTGPMPDYWKEWLENRNGYKAVG